MRHGRGETRKGHGRERGRNGKIEKREDTEEREKKAGWKVIFEM